MSRHTSRRFDETQRTHTIPDRLQRTLSSDDRWALCEYTHDKEKTFSERYGAFIISMMNAVPYTGSRNTSRCLDETHVIYINDSSSVIATKTSTSSDESSSTSSSFQMSSSKKRYRHRERKQFAERHGDLIISIMANMTNHVTSGTFGPAQVNRNGKFEFRQVRNLTGGIYMFYLVPKNKKTLILPIYVGQTTRAFCDRFKDKDLNHIFEWFDQDEFDLYAFVCELTNPQASFIKAFFLDVFNFIRNSVGSDYKRKYFNYKTVYSKTESWEMVEGKWKAIKHDLEYVFDRVQM